MFLVLLLYSIMNNMWLFIIHNTSISAKGLIENNAQNNIIVFTVHRFISTFIIKSKNPMVELSERFSPLFYVDGTWEVTERYVQVKTQSSCILIKFLFIQLFTLGVNYLTWFLGGKKLEIFESTEDTEVYALAFLFFVLYRPDQ